MEYIQAHWSMAFYILAAKQEKERERKKKAKQ